MECPGSKKGQQEGPEGHQESISQSGQTVVHLALHTCYSIMDRKIQTDGASQRKRPSEGSYKVLYDPSEGLFRWDAPSV